MASPTSPTFKVFEASRKVRPESALNDSIIPLIDRLDTEVSIARGRVEALQAAATAEFFVSDRRMTTFMSAADHIHSILASRLKTLTNLDVFHGIILGVSPHLMRSDEKRFQSRVSRLVIPFFGLMPSES